MNRVGYFLRRPALLLSLLIFAGRRRIQFSDGAELAMNGAKIELAAMLGQIILLGGKSDELTRELAKSHLHIQAVWLVGVSNNVSCCDDFHQAILIQRVIRASKLPPVPYE